MMRPIIVTVKNRRRRSCRGEDRKEADENNKAARVWISGLEALAQKDVDLTGSLTCRPRRIF